MVGYCNGHNSLCYTVNPCCLSISYIVVCLHKSYTLNLSLRMSLSPLFAKPLQSCPTLFCPTDTRPPVSRVHGDPPVKKPGVGCRALLQGIFPTQGSNPCLLCLQHWQAGPLPLASLVAQLVKNLPAMRETQVRFLGWEDPLEKETATHSSLIPRRIPWTGEPGGLQSTGSQRVGHA